MSGSGDAPLPRWARIFRHEDIPEKEVSLEQEESYLRTRMHRSLVCRTDDALQHTLDLHVDHLVTEITAFFQMTWPSDDDIHLEGRSSKRPRTSADPMVSLFSMEPPKRYPATPLLPLAVVHGPASALDRQVIVRYIVNRMRKDTKDSKMRPAVCWLRNVGSSSIRHSGPFLLEILRQV